MCPDKNLISAYYDGELEDRWQKEVERHLAGCRNCRTDAEAHLKLSRLLNSSPEPVSDDLKNSMYQSIMRRHEVETSSGAWKRVLSIPLPVLMGAAAAIIIVFVGVFTGFITPHAGEIIVSEQIPEDLTVQVISHEDAAAYILSGGKGFDLLITIPAGGALSINGEPQLIREADYKRGQ